MNTIPEVQNEFSAVSESMRNSSNTVRNFSASFLPADVVEEIQSQWREGIYGAASRPSSMFVQNHGSSRFGGDENGDRH